MRTAQQKHACKTKCILPAWAYLTFVLLTLNVFLWQSPCVGESVCVCWDGIPNAEQYQLFWGVEPGAYTVTSDKIQGTMTQYTLNDLVAGTTYYIVAKSYDSFGFSSDFSSFLSITVNANAYCGTPDIVTGVEISK